MKAVIDSFKRAWCGEYNLSRVIVVFVSIAIITLLYLLLIEGLHSGDTLKHQLRLSFSPFGVFVIHSFFIGFLPFAAIVIWRCSHDSKRPIRYLVHLTSLALMLISMFYAFWIFGERFREVKGEPFILEGDKINQKP